MPDIPDLASLLYSPDQPLPQEKAAALISALRGQANNGLLLGATRNKALQNLGAGMREDASREIDRVASLPQARAKLALEQEQLGSAQRERSAVESPAAGSYLRKAVAAATGVPVPDDVPTEALAGTKVGGAVGLLARAKEASDARRLGYALQVQKFDTTTGLKEDQFKAKRLKELSDAINPMLPRNGLKNYSDAINRAQKLGALLVDPDTGEPKKLLTPQDMTETAIALQNLVANGHGSQHEVEQLSPKSLGSDAARMLQYFTGKPWDAGQQAWALRMLHTAQREADTNRATIRESLKQRLPQFGDVRQKYGTDYSSVLKGAGLNPDAFDENGLPVQGAEVLLGTNPVLSGDVMRGAGASHGPAKSAGASPTVHVRHGGQVLEIPREDLADALRDGAVEVK